MIGLALAAGLLLQVQSPLAVQPDTLHRAHDALHYDITVVLNDSSRYVLGEVATTWRVSGPTPIVLQLDSAYRVIRVSINGKADSRGSRTMWGRPPGVVVIPQDHPAGDTVVTRIRYRGDASDGMIIRNNIHGVHTAFGDNWPDRGHLWFPSQDHPSDKASVDFHVQVPSSLQVIGPGALVKIDSLPRGGRVWHYRLTQPVPTYSMVVGVAPFARTPLPSAQCATTCVPIEVWSFREDSAYAATAFAPAPAIVDFLATIGGPFPYPQLRHVQSSTRFGGMENATEIFYDEALYPAQKMNEGLIAHETAHQWFGDAVTEADWHHVWLSEGFATYLSALWIGHAHGDSAFRAVMAAAAKTVRESPKASRPIIDPAATDLLGLLDANAYQKGSWVLHSLRGVVGDSAFFRGLRVYQDTYRHGKALSSDFANVMEQVSGQSLGWFFTQELTQPGWADLDVRWSWTNGRLTLVVTEPRASTWGFYRLPKMVVDLGGQRIAVDVDAPVTSIEVPVVTRPTLVTIDPDGAWLLTAKVTEAP
jgi:aminopeptidase N